MEDEFSKVWQRRWEHNPEVRGQARNYIRGSDRHYFLIAEVKELLPYLKPLLSTLETRSELSTLPEDFLHMTVKDFGVSRPDVDEIEKIMESYKSFTASFRDLNVFPQAVFLESPTSEVREMNKEFSNTSPELFGESYLPHISLAYYTQKNIKNLLKYLQVRRHVDIPDLYIEELLLVRDSPENASYERIKSFNL